MPGEPTPPPTSQRPRGLWPLTLVFLALLIATTVIASGSQKESVSWSELLQRIEDGSVKKVELGAEFVRVEAIDGSKPATYTVDYPGARLLDTSNAELQQAIDNANEKHNGSVVVALAGGRGPSVWSGLLPQLLFMIVLFGLLYIFVFRRMGQGGGVLSFGKSRATMINKGRGTKNFKDVAGIEEAKEEVEELVDFLRNPGKYQRLGGRIPRGVLLVGPPGTGKTLLAKAIAGEADVPFFSISGSDFVEMFVGVGASRVRDLFQQAKDASPCLIFIDEIDAVARRRGSGASTGGHDEREQTLNAILVEMDGFASNDKVIVIAATNRVDVLDPAITRPGRFDRHINVDLPDITGREQILQVHAGKVKLSADADLETIARGTPGFSGADLESLINEAALHAARFDKDVVDHEDLEYARDRIAFGKEKKTGSRSMPEDERRLTAYHEAGHAFIQYMLPECDDLHKVTIIPRGQYLGASFSLPTERKGISRKKLHGDICIAYGGRLCEEIFCDDITAGARSDIEQATRYARAMVYELGMSERMGVMQYTQVHQGFAGEERSLAVSPDTHRELDQEVRRILDDQYQRANDLIVENREAIARIAEGLLEYETLSAAQVKKLIAGEKLAPRQSITARIAKKDLAEKDLAQETTSSPVDTDASTVVTPGTADAATSDATAETASEGAVSDETTPDSSAAVETDDENKPTDPKAQA